MTKALVYLLLLFHLICMGCRVINSNNRSTKGDLTNRNTSANNTGAESSGIEWRNLPQVISAQFSGANFAWLITNKDRSLLRTTDGGASWSTIQPITPDGFEVIDFIDELRGWAVTKDDQVWRTTDGGNTWGQLTSLKPSDDEMSSIIANQILFADELHGWIIDDSSIIYTEDGGISWRPGISSSSQYPKGRVYTIFFLNPSLGWVCGVNGMIYHTKDGGKTWKEKVIANNVKFYDVLFIDESTGWLDGEDKLYSTIDGGESWQLRYAGKEDIRIGAFSFISAQEGWALGYIPNPNNAALKAGRGIVLHTTDGGRNWNQIQVGEDPPFFSKIHFVNRNSGWLLARDNIYRTDDGGQTWHTVLKLEPIIKDEK